MNRRTFLGIGTRSVLFGASGCIAGFPSSENSTETTRPTAITDTTFETGVETDVDRDEEIAITADADGATVTVDGYGQYGSSHCGYLTDREPAYDTSTDALTVEIDDEWDEPAEDEPPCSDDTGGDTFRLTVVHDDGVPAQVTAKYPFGKEETETFD